MKTVENDTVCYRKIASKNSFCDILRSLIGESQNFLAAPARFPLLAYFNCGSSLVLCGGVG
jgi:hypothetical protein